MLALLEQIATQPEVDHIDDLIKLVQLIRPPKPEQFEAAIVNVRTLTQLLKDNPSHAAGLRNYLQRVLGTCRQTSLYTDIGILSSDGFFTELYRRLTYRILPPALDCIYLSDCLDLVLFANTDYQWIHSVPVMYWLELFDVLEQSYSACDTTLLVCAAPLANATDQKMLTGILEAIRTLSYRISATGLEPSLIRIHPDIENYESPFLMQNIEVNQYLDSYTHYLTGDVETTEDALHLLVMLDQCDTVVAKIRKNALRLGTSVALTYLLVGLTQSIDRLRKLLSIVNIAEPLPIEPKLEQAEILKIAEISPQRAAAVALGLELVEALNKKYAVRDLFTSNIHLLARNVTENASRTGEHYIAENKKEYGAMFRSSAGAGFIIGFMALIKILMTHLRAAPLVEAFLFSMNYSLGFMLIHVLHFTVATKQPAMTASRIASGLYSQDSRHVDLDSMAELIIKVLRTQFVAVLGNLTITLPTAYLIAVGYFYLNGQHLVSPDKARHLLHDVDPLASLALFHAAIAGVFLFLAGLISGYYDNRALYSRMALRVTQLRGLRKLLGESRLARLGSYLENNLGGLMGNFYFGIMLGSMGTVGYMIGLPLDVRHITFSSAYVSISIVGLEHKVTWQVMATSIAGILAIGVVNLTVSFGLALLVALRSRRGKFDQGFMLSKTLLKRFWKTPKDFLWAPADPPEPTKTNEDALTPQEVNRAPSLSSEKNT